MEEKFLSKLPTEEKQERKKKDKELSRGIDRNSIIEGVKDRSARRRYQRVAVGYQNSGRGGMQRGTMGRRKEKEGKKKNIRHAGDR